MENEITVRYTDLIRSLLDFISNGNNNDCGDLRDKMLDMHCSFMEVIKALDSSSTVVKRIQEVTQLTQGKLATKCFKNADISDVINTVYCFNWWLPKEVSYRLFRWFEKTIRSQLQ